MAVTQATINNSGQVLQTYLKKRVLENFEPMLRFYEMGKKPVWQDGFKTLAFTKVDRLTRTSAQTLLTEGTTPATTAMTMTTITLNANQYGMFVTLTDILLDVAPIPLIKEAAGVVGDNMARVVDAVIQSNLELNGTNVIYSGGAANRAALWAGDVCASIDLAKANAFLSTKAAPQYGDGYVGVMHPNVIFDLQNESTTGGYIDLNKYTRNVEKVFRGEIGKLFNVRIVKSAYVQTFSSTVTVYPTYVIWKGAYGVANLQSMQTYITPRKASDSDPLAQRVKVGCKIAFNSIILQQDSLVRIESASSLSYSFS